MPNVEQSTVLTLSEQEAIYLRELTGLVTPSELPHGQWANDLFETLDSILPPLSDEPIYAVTNTAVRAIDVG